jgi:tight adherence protein C
MTIKQAWIKIAEDYKSLDSQRRGIKRYAYEEMLTTVRELKLGMPENISYEQYGSRTGLIPFIKFSSLITQNLKKGTKGFTELLMQEAREAFEDRKEIAKRLGEEAGTKLLIPMMIMLIIVFLIIMIPSFLSFRI